MKKKGHKGKTILYFLWPFLFLLVNCQSSKTDSRRIQNETPFCQLVQDQYQALGAPTQIILTIVQNKDSHPASVSLMQKNEGGWSEVDAVMPAVAGIKGIGLGHEWAKLRPEMEGWNTYATKVEGDKRAPIGFFGMGKDFADLPILETTECVDDTNSKYYNQVVDRAKSNFEIDWNSSEKMAKEPLYKKGAVITYSSNAKERAGSCIFMHIWRTATKGTAGCIALEEKNLDKVLAILKHGNTAMAILSKEMQEDFLNCL
jgi:D-alanyl-D-alanine dipeptidase